MRGLLKYAAILVLCLFALAFWQRDYLAGWWQVRQLALADPTSQKEQIARLIPLGVHVLPHLFSQMQSPEPSRWENCHAALMSLCQKSNVSTHLGDKILQAIHREFCDAPPIDRQQGLLQATATLLDQPSKAPPGETQVKLIQEIFVRSTANDVLRPQGLMLASTLLAQHSIATMQKLAEESAVRALADANAQSRAAAICVLQLPEFRSMHNTKVAQRLHDVDADVRQLALLSLSEATELVSNDDLLPLLRDENPKIQHVTEIVLKNRGLSETQLKLARLATDPSPAERVKVVDYLSDDIDMGIWLKQLRYDAAPSVRVAALRMAVQKRDPQAQAWLDEMAQSDPSPSVRQIADYYRKR